MDIKEFDFDEFPPLPFIVFASKRRSGKSVAIRDLTYSYFIKKKKYRKIWVCCPTAELTDDYKFIQDEYRLDDFTKDFLDELIETQTTAIKGDKDGKHETLLILDDIANSTNRLTIDLLGKLAAVGRHLKISVILSIQSFKREFSPLLRFNADVIVMWKQHNHDNRLDIIKNWLSTGRENKELAYKLLDTVPDKYRCIIVDNTKTSDDFSDFVFHYTFELKKIPNKYIMYR